jgi:hypothetical protein
VPELDPLPGEDGRQRERNVLSLAPAEGHPDKAGHEQEVPRLREDQDVVIGADLVFQLDGGGHPGEAAADDDDALLGCH